MGCFISGDDYRWPKGTIPYEFSDKLSGDQIAVIQSAIDAWNKQTAITLVARTKERDYVLFTQGPDCFSKVGRQGGGQNITCSFKDDGTVIHEIGHAVGMWHEQSRQDRDIFIGVHLENVQPGQLHNFERHIDDGDITGPYDFDSVMHYGPRSRAIDWRPGCVIEGQQSKSGPGLAVTSRGLHMVHLGDSSNDIWWSRFDGTSWKTSDGTPGNEKIPDQQSKTNPALAVYNNELHMVHLGDSSNNIWWSRYDGTSWKTSDGTPGNEKIPDQQSKTNPALAVYNNELHMVHLGDSSNNIWWSRYDGTSWKTSDGTPGNEKIPDQQSKTNPALAVYNNELHMVHLGDSSNNIWWSRYDGTSWKTSDGTPGNEKIPDQQSKTNPALAVYNNQLHMVHLGDSSNNIWNSDYSGLTWRANRRKYVGQSKATPALASTAGQFYMIHTGGQSNRIWQALFDNSLLTIVPPAGVTVGLEDHLSLLDIQTVADTYA